VLAAILKLAAVLCLCLATLTACGGATLEPKEPGPNGSNEIGVNPVGPTAGEPPSTGGNVGVNPGGPHHPHPAPVGT
jgi:hypothetical protein